ncbi:thiol reductant ABC exporter subunit CydD [Alkalicoccus chagannorensis]|nr:thiol reductant ABC exporter subunit CydD [Alkalicoccus chagannorensis]
MIISVLIGLTIIAQAWLIVAVVDNVFLQGASFQEVLPELAGVMLALGARSILQYVNNLTGIRLAADVKQEFRTDILRHFRSSPVRAAGEGQSGGRISLALDAVDELEPYFRHYYVVMMQSSLVPLIVLGAVFYMNWVSGLILLVTAPFVPIMMAVIGRNTERKSEEQMEKLNRFAGTFLDLLRGLTTLRLFNQAGKQAAVIEADSNAYRDATMTVLKVAFLSALMLEFISMLSISLVALEVGLRMVVYDQLSFFTAFFVLILAPEFFASLKEMGSAFHSGRGSMGAAERIYEELDSGSETAARGDLERKGPPAFTFRSVTFDYGESRFALGPLDLTVNAGEHAAVIGPSGSGKSTLLHLFSGLYEAGEGTVGVDGRAIQEYEQEQWYADMAYVTQHPYLFAGTFRDNLRLGSPDASDEEVERAAAWAGLTPLMQEMPEGLDTVIGEGGRGISGGEKQRTALARAYLKQPSLLLYDEPTTGLDIETERILQRAMNELSERATVITVAHRLHTIREADRIFLMEEGALEAQGRHEELRQSSRNYQNMLEVQQGGAGR